LSRRIHWSENAFLGHRVRNTHTHTHTHSTHTLLFTYLNL